MSYRSLADDCPADNDSENCFGMSIPKKAAEPAWRRLSLYRRSISSSLLRFTALCDARSPDRADGYAGKAADLPPPHGRQGVLRPDPRGNRASMRLRIGARFRFYPPERRLSVAPAALRSVLLSSNVTHLQLRIIMNLKIRRQCYWKKNISTSGCAASWRNSKR